MWSRLFYKKHSISSPTDTHAPTQAQTMSWSTIDIKEESKASFDSNEQWDRRHFIIFQYDNNRKLAGYEWNWQKNSGPSGIMP